MRLVTEGGVVAVVTAVIRIPMIDDSDDDSE